MELVVKTEQGSVRGVAAGGVVAFKGIPYAAPPFGANRFAPPAPAPAWDGVREAAAYGPTVLKPPYGPHYDQLLPEPVIEGEDCLNLNVWTPDPGGSGLPVLVWIHGGAFVNGSGAVPTYDGSAFARDGVVTVTINYRLGADGFLFFDDGGPANLGLLDQVAALRWVRANIAAFGGDPDNVTIAGQSAGGMSVGALLAMPRAAGLFRRAIPMSGSGFHAHHPATSRLISADFAKRLGVPLGRDSLAGVPVPALLEAQLGIGADVVTQPDPARWGEVTLNLLPFEPTIDGDVLPALPIQAIAGGSAAGVDLLTGATVDEQRLFTVPNGAIDFVNDDILNAVVSMGYRLPAGGLDVYRAAAPGAKPGELLADIGTDWFFRVPAIRLAEAQIANGARAYVYEFGWRSPRYDGRLGACHALDIGFVFDTLHAEGGGALQADNPPQSLADAMHRAWVGFITDGDPGWAPYDTRRRPTMVFGDSVEVVDDPRAEQRALWDGVR
jgi:para-nitrobenzyl esterase